MCLSNQRAAHSEARESKRKEERTAGEGKGEVRLDQRL